MLKNKFWTGLRQDFKDISGYLYDKCETFDELRKEIRLIEKEHPKERKKVTPHMNVAASTSSSSEEIAELKAMIHKLSTKVDSLESKQDSYRESTQPVPEQSNSQPYNYNNRGRRKSRGNQSNRSRKYDNKQSSVDRDDEPTCHRCGQLGHLSYGCRVNLDKVQRNLNANRPVSKGGC